jgi:hypothetical protein
MIGQVKRASMLLGAIRRLLGKRLPMAALFFS